GRRVTVAERRLAEGAVEVPAAAPDHPDRAPLNNISSTENFGSREQGPLAEWGAQQTRRARGENHPFLRIELVGAPLPHIAMHVAQAQLVRGIGADPRCPLEVLSLQRLAERKLTVEVCLRGGQVVGRLIKVEVIGTF